MPGFHEVPCEDPLDGVLLHLQVEDLGDEGDVFLSLPVLLLPEALEPLMDLGEGYLWSLSWTSARDISSLISNVLAGRTISKRYYDPQF
jgi:hypothetical protein